MSPERWRQVEGALFGVLALEDGEPAAFLEQVCGDDPDLLCEVTSLLEAHESAEGFLEGRAEDQLPDWPASLAASSEAGERIGSYLLLEEIGRGGMSTVYLAARTDEDYDHRVALKLIKRGLDTDSVLRRFRGERQILARFRHPNIAHFYDGGSTGDGRPFFVMEHIEGTRIDDYCEAHRLSTVERIELFRQVCSAVHYAHQNLIVHRDIKPSNILVDQSGVPKLLDFGIAKLLDPEAASPGGETTHAGLRPMTPRYASPEQLGGLPITTASDVYSLGALLHKLLVGRLPEERAAEPTDRFATAPSAAGQHRLSGDLEKIVHMSLREEPVRRYASAEQLSDDLWRYLGGLPVRARRDTLGYRTAKFLRRHRVATAAAAAFLALLASFFRTLAWQVDETGRERDRAELERDKAEQVADLLFDLFASFDPGRARGDTVTARELLDRGTEKIQRQLRDQEPLQAAAFDLIGRVYQSLGIYDRALPLIERGLALRLEALGEDHLDVAASLTNIGAVSSLTGNYVRAEALHREALALRRKRLGQEHLEVADSLSHLAITLWYQGRYEEAEHLQRQALALQRRLLDEDELPVATSLSNLGNVLFSRGEASAAEQLTREALAIERKFLGEDHPDVATSMSNLAASLAQQENYEAAEPLFREALAIRSKLFGDEHPDVAEAMHGLGSLLSARGVYEEAEELLRGALEMRRGFLGENHVNLAINLSVLASLLQAKGDLEGAAEACRESLEIGRRVVPPGHPGLAHPLLQLGRILLEMGHAGEAKPLLREAYELRKNALPETSPLSAETAAALGVCLRALGNYAEAEQLLLEGYRILKAREGEPGNPQPDAQRRLLDQLISLYETWGKPRKADEYRALATPGPS